jgi:hypothetical protein
MPFSGVDDWSFTSTRSPAETETPSMVCVPDRVMLPVVATLTLGLASSPAETESSWPLVTASPEAVPSASPVIFWPFMVTGAAGSVISSSRMLPGMACWAPIPNERRLWLPAAPSL